MYHAKIKLFLLKHFVLVLVWWVGNVVAILNMKPLLTFFFKIIKKSTVFVYIYICHLPPHPLTFQVLTCMTGVMQYSGFAAH